MALRSGNLQGDTEATDLELSCVGAQIGNLRVVSILVSFQDESTGEITFYMKGADVVMAGIVQYNDWLEEEVRNGPRDDSL